MRYENTSSRRLPLLLLLLLLVLLLFASSCEETDITAPVGSVITVTPTPSAVIIDQVNNEESDQSFIVAQVTVAGGQPVTDLPLFFTSTGGLLDSVNNVCQAGLCSRSGGACTADPDCPVLPPQTILTDNNGVATDTLTLRLFGDPDSVMVTVKATGLEGTATVTKIINNGAADPVPLIQATPPGGQRTGVGFIFDGSDSTFDPSEDPTCYDWRITSNKAVFNAFPAGGGCEICDPLPGGLCVKNCTTRGPFTSTVDLTIGEEGDITLDQTLSVFLKVSGQEGVVCNNSVVPDQSIFGPNIDTLIYPLECDLTPPTVTLPSLPDVSLSGDGNGSQVSVSVSAVATDPEFPDLFYLWNCGGGNCSTATGPCDDGVDPPGIEDLSSVTCTFFGTGNKTVSVSVRNACGLVGFASDSLDVDE